MQQRRLSVSIGMMPCPPTSPVPLPTRGLVIVTAMGVTPVEEGEDMGPRDMAEEEEEVVVTSECMEY